MCLFVAFKLLFVLNSSLLKIVPKSLATFLIKHKRKKKLLNLTLGVN